MMDKLQQRTLRNIPLDLIDVLNTRDRNKRVFADIVGNFQKVGLKKPVTVAPRRGEDGSERYLLLCGEGRLKAFRSLGETEIPALVVEVDNEDAFIISLAENIARRQYRPLEVLSGIKRLNTLGYSANDIATKTGLNPTYVGGILNLLTQGEERLLIAVETGKVPLNTALEIVGAGDDDTALQAAMQEAYESGRLRGKQLTETRKVIQRRQSLGRCMGKNTQRKKTDVSASGLVRTYEREVARQKLVVRKAELTQQRLLFVVSALRQLFADENFINLLRAEHLDTLPSYLADRVWPAGSAA
ncbi:plasmid partitioning protein RepB C-terminal domain-containing protein [Silvimonas iriomotensis]|uniref:Chromosome partitioning protein ParB n=1 Tax=Silvimonas iriomotensis TaxID=449662 RepID=A0ABQ2PE75_9NEIS|nr:plasmid partitioning protein RepB C-terminal domain-containing protein [Silvimonas iriomotensis]GGP23795.1 chromosome partitioning protein ParB [Silvimonas iriomotensis]